ncbi:MAG: glycosyltransferase [Pyrinomonadaceae bacterium MAG19_C2-C3]|nr:glycosyltransferase [Pyrinomonadaceae bacterium MAG19_C2-C3]
MKLCWLIPDDRGGGVASVALSCCRQAMRAGHDTVLLMLLPPSGWIEDETLRVASLNLYPNAAETPRVLIEWLNANAPDVLILNGCKEADAAIPYLPRNVKCAYVVHDTAAIYWNKAVECEDDLEAIVAVSETVAGKFRHKLRHPEKLLVIHNGCHFPNLPPRETARNDSLIFLGGDNPMKGAFDVLEVWRELIEKNFDGDLHWFGDLKESLRNSIDKLPRRERIVLYGRTPRSQIFFVAAQSKVLLMLSRVEPFGMATIEAMSMGCVPVAWDIETGTKEIVTANRTGFFAALGDVKSLAGRVMTACDNHDMLVDKVVARARVDFDEAVMWNNYQSLLEDVLKMSPRERSKAHQETTLYKAPSPRFQLLPLKMRFAIRRFVGRSPRLGYWLRDIRGR